MCPEIRGPYSNTHLKEFGLDILQPRDGYRFSMDSLLLVDFVTLRPWTKVLDIGTGCGVIALCLARRFENVELAGIEIQSSLFRLAMENVLRNGLEARIRIVNGDIRDCGEIFSAGSFHAVVSNPPYRSPDSGRLCPNAQEALSRHEIMLDLNLLLESVRYLLCPGGHFFIIYPADRAAMLLANLGHFRLEPKVIRFVHPRPGSEARMCLVDAVKDARPGGLRVRPPLYVNEHRYGQNRRG